MITHDAMTEVGIHPPESDTLGEEYVILIEDIIRNGQNLDDQEFRDYVSESLDRSPYLVHIDQMWEVFRDLGLHRPLVQQDEIWAQFIDPDRPILLDLDTIKGMEKVASDLTYEAGMALALENR